MDQQPEIPIPAGLEESLRALHGRAPAVPAEVDARVIADARRVLGGRRSLRFPAGGALAAAAVLAMAVGLPLYLTLQNVERRSMTAGGPAAGGASPGAARPGDLDGDGRIDIVDAMVLATALSRSAPAPDINADGVSDHEDVDALALLAVRLEGGGT